MSAYSKVKQPVEEAAKPIKKAGKVAAKTAAKPVKAAVDATREFLRLESAGGILLMAAAAAAMLMMNSPLAGTYESILNIRGEVRLGDLAIIKPLLLWVNDFWMAIFFLLVGLEIKREVVQGALSSWSQASLPLVGAIGGLAVPAAIFVALNWGSAETLDGWAVPTATDIAFALGVLTLFGKRVPVELKIFLLALAIIDDLAAIMIIAAFYTSDLSLLSLGLAALGLVALLALNRKGVTNLTPYLLIGIAIWVCVLKSGVHATLAGVAVAMFIPLSGKDGATPGPKLEHELHPWVAYLILPAFAFANAGVPLGELSLESLVEPLPLGIVAGLFIGKQLGVFGACWIAVRTGLCKLPPGIGWRTFYGVCVLTGIGFTMSLFIGTLAFYDAETLGAMRFGVLCGSLLAALVGYAVLSLVLPRAGSGRRDDAAQSGEGRDGPKEAETRA